MRSPEYSGGRTIGVRLSTIDIKIRRRFGWLLIERAKEDGDILSAVALTAAVENPTDKVYWVPEEAVRRVLGNGR